MSNICKRVALAICTASPRAGAVHGEANDVETRAARLIDPRVGYGSLPYIAEGDIREWAPGCAVTIFLEQKGGVGDCGVPFDYYGGGIDVSVAASRLLSGFYIEFINAAVAAVYRG